MSKTKKKFHQVAIFIVETLLASQAVLAHTITSCNDYQNHQPQTGFEPRSINEKLIFDNFLAQLIWCYTAEGRAVFFELEKEVVVVT